MCPADDRLPVEPIAGILELGMDVGRLLLEKPKLNFRKKAPAAVACCVLTALAGLALALHAAPPTSITDRMSTLERVAQPGWWPTKMLASNKDYVGSQACAKCHAAISASFKNAEMSKALLPAADSEVLRTHEGTAFDLESYTYKLESTPQGPQFSVSQRLGVGEDADYLGVRRRHHRPGLFERPKGHFSREPLQLLRRDQGVRPHDQPAPSR